MTCLGKLIALDWVGPLVLCRSEVSRVPAGIGGVYVLHALAHEFGGYPAFYVGRSQDLHRRLLEHMGGRTAKPLVLAVREVERTYWSAAPVADPAARERVESALIRLLAPPCNAQVPEAEPALVNLPPMSFIP